METTERRYTVCSKLRTQLTPKKVSALALHSFFIVFHGLIVVQVSFCSLIKRITQNICRLCIILINSVILNLLCV